MRLRFWVALLAWLLAAGCAHPIAPEVTPTLPPQTLLIYETLPGDWLICFPMLPLPTWHVPEGCFTIAELRQMARTKMQASHP